MRELGLISHPLRCVPEPARDSGQQRVPEVWIEPLVELSVELRIVETTTGGQLQFAEGCQLKPMLERAVDTPSSRGAKAPYVGSPA